MVCSGVLGLWALVLLSLSYLSSVCNLASAVEFRYDYGVPRRSVVDVVRHPRFGDTAVPRRWRPLPFRHRGGAEVVAPAASGVGLLSVVRISRTDDGSFAPAYLTVTRQELSDAVGCNLRDVRVLTAPPASSGGAIRTGSCFLPRPRGIIVHVRNVRAAILRGEVWVVVPPRPPAAASVAGPPQPSPTGTDPRTDALVEEIVENLNDIARTVSPPPRPVPPPTTARGRGRAPDPAADADPSPPAADPDAPSFVLATLEILLAHIVRDEAALVDEVLADAARVLGDIANTPSIMGTGGAPPRRGSFIQVQSRLRELLPLKNTVDRLGTTCEDACSALSEVLKSDEDMDDMLALDAPPGTAAAPAHRPGAGHAELELLFEDYLLQVDEIHATVRDVQNRVTNTEEVVEIELDLMRNTIMRTELLLEMTALVVGCGAAITGLFGMNLVSHVEVHASMFYLVSGFIVMLMSGMGYNLLRHLRTENIL